MHRAGAPHFRCVPLPGWEALLEALDGAPPASVAVVDPYAESAERRTLSPRLRALLSRFPGTAVLAALELGPGCFHDLRTLGEWGVSGVIALDPRETTESIARKLRSARGRPLHSLLAHGLPAFVPGRGRAVLAAAAETAVADGETRGLADALHLSDRALQRRCERARLPPPRRVLAWMRVLHAAELLDRPEETVLSVAHASGYATESSLRRALRELTGRSPSELRRAGAFAAAAEAFVRELERRREG